MAKATKINGDVAKFKMSVSGGSLPEGFKAIIKVEVDYTGMSRESLIEIASGGQSLRVALQGQLRKKRIPELNKLAETGLKCKAVDVVKGETSSPTDKLLALSKEEFVEVMVRDFAGMVTAEQAAVIYDTKHGVGVDSEEESEEEVEESEN